MTKMVVMSPGTPAMSFIRKQMSNANIFFASCMIVTVCGPRLLNITDSDHAMYVGLLAQSYGRYVYGESLPNGSAYK